MKLIDIEVYSSGGQLKWSRVWRAGKDGKLNRNYNTDDFKQLRRDRSDAGWKLIDVETYTVGGKRKWAGIWEKTSTAEHYLYGYKYCDILKKHADYQGDDYELLDLERY